MENMHDYSQTHGDRISRENDFVWKESGEEFLRGKDVTEDLGGYPPPIFFDCSNDEKIHQNKH